MGGPTKEVCRELGALYVGIDVSKAQLDVAALAHLGKGSDFKELIRIIRFPGYTTPAELAFSIAIIDSMQAHVQALRNLNTQLLAASKLVVAKE